MMICTVSGRTDRVATRFLPSCPWRPLLLALVLGLASASTARAGLIGYWNFNETSGPTAFDSAGAVNGTLQGGAAFAPGLGISGGAIQLNSASNGYVNMGNNFAFNGSSDFTIQAWFKTAANANDGMFVVAQHHSTIYAGYFLGLNDSADGLGDGTIHFYVGTIGGYNAGKSDLAVNDGQWHQAVEVYQAGGQSKLYIDGTLQDSRAAVLFNTTATPFLVGGIGNSANIPTGAFTGLIDEVRIYNSALSAGEVLTLFQQTQATTVPEPSSMLAWAAVMLGACLVRSRRKPVVNNAMDAS